MNLPGYVTELLVAARAAASPSVRVPFVSRARAGQSRPADAACLLPPYPLLLGPSFHVHGLRVVRSGTDAASLDLMLAVNIQDPARGAVHLEEEEVLVEEKECGLE